MTQRPPHLIDALVWVPIVATFPVVGWLVGWLVGASNSPVVATALPLVFGVFGAMGYRSLARQVPAPDATAHSDLPRRPILLAVSCGGLILFCLACFAGLQWGMSARVPRYRPLSEVVGLDDVTPEERTVLYRIRWGLQARGIPVREADAFFGDVIETALKAETDPVRRIGTLEQVAENLKAAPSHSRGLAHDDPEIPSPPDSEPG